MCISKNKALILNHGNVGYFMDPTTGMKQTILFKFEKFPSNQNISDRGQII